MSQLHRAKAVVGELRRGGVRHTATRTARSVRQFGVLDALRRARGLGTIYEWRRLSLPDALREMPLGDDVELRRCGHQDLNLYSQLATADNLTAAPAWLDDGDELYLVVSGERVAFACWIFPERMPMGEARGGWLHPPPGAVLLEHSVTSPDFRGRGMAPGAWSAVTTQLRDRGVETVMTKIESDNVAVDRALAKVGFVKPDDDNPVMRDFAQQLGR